MAKASNFLGKQAEPGRSLSEGGRERKKVQEMPRRIERSTRSVEKLHHFICIKCSKWWSVGDAPLSKTKWFCPWCGVKNKYESFSQKDKFH
jgi:rubrerythrin